MKITVDEAKCCGAGQCVLIAPEVFDQREDDGIVELLQPSPVPEFHDGPDASPSTTPTSSPEASPAYA